MKLQIVPLLCVLLGATLIGRAVALSQTLSMKSVDIGEAENAPGRDDPFQEYDAWEQELSERDRALTTREQQAALALVEAERTVTVLTESTASNSRFQQRARRLAVVYGGMDADRAAATLAGLPVEKAAPVIEAMATDVAGPILTAMPEAQAKSITDYLLTVD